MSELIEEIERQGAVPVVVIEAASDGPHLGESLLAGGMSVIEVTLRTPAALEAIAAMQDVSGLQVGAGTVLSAEQVQTAKDAGARFIVSPGLDKKVVETAVALGLPVFPGTTTATEVQAAHNQGLTHVKFFPAGLAGGPKILQALGTVFKDVKFMATGGISPDNLASYLELASVFACGVGFVAPAELVRSGGFQEITSRAANALGLVTAARTQN
jgi:2-dehydro-3-deoxyphosphogluconate aldolase / (4S)-4-hydroxy-2-oxoglutarate aldolase